MINLIPNEEKKKITRDFYLRLITVFFVMLGFSLLIGSILLLPSFFVSYEEETAVNSKLETQKKEVAFAPDEETLSSFKDIKNKLNLIENIKKNKITFSQKVINEIILKKIPSIKITEIFYQNDPKTGIKININGIAPNRETLLSFRRSLEESKSFSKIDLPISNFVKESNIQFYLSLIPS